MNITAFYVFQCVFFFNALLTKKKLTPNALRTGRAGLRAGILSAGPCHVTSGRSAGQKQQHFGNSLFCFSLQGGFSFFIFKLFIFFFQILHERWGGGEKFCSSLFGFCKTYAPEQSTSTISPILGTSTNWYTNRWPSTLAKMPRWQQYLKFK